MSGSQGSIGPYEILGELGRGGMGVVLHARRADLKREFALKVIAPGQDASPEVIARFRREAQAAGELAGHPGIVGCHDIGEADGRIFFAMDLVDGPSLEDALLAGDLDPRRSAGLIAGAARAVQHAHDRGILHRDLKPGNIMIAPDGGARVTDFGLAKAQATDSESAKLTKSGVILGTPAYMPPEQASGESVDGRADVYALGATLYELLTDRPPFEAGSLVALLAAIQREDPMPPRKRNHTVPRPLDTIVLQCLEKAPERRYASAGDLADDLERWLRGDPISASPPSVAYRVRRAIARRKGFAIGAGLGLAAIAGTLAIVLPMLEAAGERAKAESEAAERAKLETIQEQARLALGSAKDMWRAGSLQRAEVYAGQLTAACDAWRATAPKSPRPDCLLASWFRTAEEPAMAEAAIARALELDPDDADGRYERALLSARAYLDRLQALMFSSGREKRGKTPLDLTCGDSDSRALHLRSQLLEDLRFAPESRRTVAGALHAFLEGDPAGAEGALDRALADPEAPAVLFVARALLAEAGREPLIARDIWARGADRHRGSLRLREGLAWVRIAVIDVHRRNGKTKELIEEIEATRRDFEALLQRRPGTVTWHRQLGSIHCSDALRLLETFQPEAAKFEQGLAEFEKALAAAPNDPATYRLRGDELKTWASRLRSVRRNATPQATRALADYHKAHELGADDADLWGDISELCLLIGQAGWIYERKEPAEWFDRAEAAATESLRLEPRSSSAATGVANVHKLRAHIASLRGVDPSLHWQRARSHAARAVELTEAEPSRRSRVLWWRAEMLGSWAKDALRTGRPFREELEGAIADLEAIQHDPEWRLRALLELGRLRMEQGVADGMARRSPRPAYAKAITALEQAAKLRPGYYVPLTSLGGVLSNDAGAAYRYEGLDPRPIYDRARTTLNQVISAQADNFEAWRFRGSANYGHFRYLRDTGRPAHQLARDAMRDLGEASRLFPKQAESLRGLIAACEKYLRENPEKR